MTKMGEAINLPGFTKIIKKVINLFVAQIPTPVRCVTTYLFSNEV